MHPVARTLSWGSIDGECDLGGLHQHCGGGSFGQAEFLGRLLDPPHASPRNVFAGTIAGMDIHGTTVRVRGADHPDGSTGLAADVTAAASADLDLAPGQSVYFVVKTQETELHPALSPAAPVHCSGST